MSPTMWARTAAAALDRALTLGASPDRLVVYMRAGTAGLVWDCGFAV